MFDYQEELGGVFLNLFFQGGLELEGYSGFFSSCGVRSQLRFFSFRFIVKWTGLCVGFAPTGMIMGGSFWIFRFSCCGVL